MAVEEIIRSYRQAANKRKQIGILADLNDCDRADIIQLLEWHGAYNAKNKIPKPGRVFKYDWGKAWELYTNGATNREISNALGCSIITAAKWARNLNPLNE